jgi:hypothetical protein
MKHSKIIVLSLLIFSLTLNSCNDELELDIKQPDALIVVDGWIENGKQAKVFLTTNTPYFTTIDSSSLRNLVLSQAKVTISDGDNSEVLILRKDARYFPPYYYAGNTIYGDTGKIYTLIAEYGGKSIVSQTTIPSRVMIDTTFFELNTGEDSLGFLRISFTDPGEVKNYYRIFTMLLGEEDKFISSFIIAINDQYFNGNQISFTLRRPPESFLSTAEVDYFTLGDTILIKLCAMDQQSFDFWSSYQDEVINATNPFAASLNDVKTNILGDGLGIWGGYGVSIDTLFTALQ